MEQELKWAHTQRQVCVRPQQLLNYIMCSQMFMDHCWCRNVGKAWLWNPESNFTHYRGMSVAFRWHTRRSHTCRQPIRGLYYKTEFGVIKVTRSLTTPVLLTDYVLVWGLILALHCSFLSPPRSGPFLYKQDADSIWDVNVRVGKAAGVLWRLQPICNPTSLNLRIKIRLLKSIVIPTALYASETWRSTNAIT